MELNELEYIIKLIILRRDFLKRKYNALEKTKNNNKQEQIKALQSERILLNNISKKCKEEMYKYMGHDAVQVSKSNYKKLSLGTRNKEL